MHTTDEVERHRLISRVKLLKTDWSKLYLHLARMATTVHHENEAAIAANEVKSLGGSMMNRRLLSIVLLAVAAVPFAAADTIDLTHNNLGISGSIGTINLLQQGSNVLVTITASSGYGLKLQGGSVYFNTNASITSAMIGPVSIVAGGNTYTGLSFGQIKTTQSVAGYNFSYQFSNLQGGPNGITNASSISFLISGVTVQQLEQLSQNNPYMWGVHFCVGDGTTCGRNTGYSQGNLKVVPEPGTLSLLGTGMVGLAALMRRRLSLSS